MEPPSILSSIPTLKRPSQASPDSPIGVFDSGVGGLTVLREIRRELPAEHLLYVADSAHAPYGDKSRDRIEERSVAITEFLIGQGAKAIVIACNTATGAAAAALRGRFDLPIVAMEPAIKPAVGLTRSGVVGVLATSQTLASDKFETLRGRFDGHARVLVQPCPGLVERIEAGEHDGDSARALIADYVRPLIAQGADILVLGCTHYPLARVQIQDIAGPGVTITDAGAAVARQLRVRLEQCHGLSTRDETGTERFWSSGQPDTARAMIGTIWGRTVEVGPLRL
jgi:glutamate racemase